MNEREREREGGEGVDRLLLLITVLKVHIDESVT